MGCSFAGDPRIDRQIVTHRDLEVWRVAVDLAERIYALTEHCPSHERFGLALQLRRSAVSVPSNIAEGAARGRRAEFIQFLRVARGSVAELETQLLISNRRSLFQKDAKVDDLIDRVYRLLNGLISALRR